MAASAPRDDARWPEADGGDSRTFAPRTGRARRDLAQRLGACVLFAGLDEASLARLARDTTARELTPGEHLWSTGQRADVFTVVDRGVFQVQEITAAGDSVVLGLCGAGDSIGLPATLARGRHASTVGALATDSAVLRIRAEPVLDALTRSAPLAMAINRALIADSVILHAKIEIVTAGSVPRRLAALFLHLIARFGVPAAAASVRIPIGLTREQIGDFVSTRVETVSRILSRWQKAGWLRSGRGAIEILRPDMLQRVLGV